MSQSQSKIKTVALSSGDIEISLDALFSNYTRRELITLVFNNGEFLADEDVDPMAYMFFGSRLPESFFVVEDGSYFIKGDKLEEAQKIINIGIAESLDGIQYGKKWLSIAVIGTKFLVNTMKSKHGYCAFISLDGPLSNTDMTEIHAATTRLEAIKQAQDELASSFILFSGAYS